MKENQRDMTTKCKTMQHLILDWIGGWSGEDFKRHSWNNWKTLDCISDNTISLMLDFVDVILRLSCIGKCLFP